MISAYRHTRRVALLFGFLLLIGTVSVLAQPRQRMGDPEQRLERMMTHLTSTLNLDEGQAAKVREILGDQIKKQQGIFDARREQAQQQRQEMREEMEKWRAETDARMADVLTDEQVEKYTKYMEDNRRRPRGERGGRRGPRGRRG